MRKSPRILLLLSRGIRLSVWVLVSLRLYRLPKVEGFPEEAVEIGGCRRIGKKG